MPAARKQGAVDELGADGSFQACAVDGFCPCLKRNRMVHICFLPS
jgi:hypothetical protein